MEYIYLDKDLYLTNPDLYEDLIYDFHNNNGSHYKKGDLNLYPAITEWGGCFVIAVENNKAVCLARIAVVYGRKTIYMLRQIDTLPEYKGQGIATNVVNFACESLTKTNATKLISAVHSGNLASIKLHTKCGFTLKEPPSYIKNDKHRFWTGALYFEKPIEKNYDL